MKRNWWKWLVSPKPRISKPRTVRLSVETLEERCQPSVSGFSSIDGIGNNIADPTQGTAGTDLLRLSPAGYRPVENGGDGLNTPSLLYGAPDFIAGPRLVSNIVSNQATELFGSTDINTVNGKGLSDFSYTFGQFIDHDMSLTPDQGGQPRPADPNLNRDGGNGFPIPKDPLHDGLPTPGVDGPEVVDPIGFNENTLAFSRSVFNPTTGITTPREQINVSTSYLDLSQIYGSTLTVSDALRTHSGGMMKTSAGADGIIGTKDDLLPYLNSTYFTTIQLASLSMANDARQVQSTELFAAGDPRANETTELTALQTLFVRNHNLIARQLAQQNPSKFGFASWTDDNLFNEARKLNIAQYQHIIYDQYLPALLGPDAMPEYTGYKADVDASISTEFSTVAFRFGHSTLNNEVHRDNNDGTGVMNGSTSDGVVLLQHTFFNPNLLKAGGVIDPLTGHISTDIGAVLKGDADHTAQAMDLMAVSSVRNLLFGHGGQGEDLIARDLWRANDHGIGTYNDLRVAFGLPPITDTNFLITDPTDGFTFVSHGFEQISSDVHTQRLLSDAFTGPTREGFLANGKFAGDIHPFVAGLAEDHVPGSDMGALFTRILVDQFTRLRDGDRFFYLNESFNSKEKAFLKDGNTLAKVIMANTNITNLQKDVFFFDASISGKVYEAKNEHSQSGQKIAGITVELLDALTGNVVATTVTDNRGNYTFNVTSTGNYKIRVVTADGQEQRNSPTIKIIEGNTKVKKVDIAVIDDDFENPCHRGHR